MLMFFLRTRREHLPGIHFADCGADGRIRHVEPGENRAARFDPPGLAVKVAEFFVAG